jgi:hypothetical protein
MERIGCNMSLQAHIDSLAEKRASIKQKISEESARPMPDFNEITNLKKLNLTLKQEMQHYLIMLDGKSYNASS